MTPFIAPRGSRFAFIVRAAWLFFAVTLSFAMAPGVAWAQQGKVREELPEKVRANWDAAGELFDDANFEAALLQYQAVYKESKNPRVLYNIGVCWKERKYYAQAATAWEAQLAQKDKLPKAEIDRATTAIETVRPFITTLDLESNQSGAKLSIKDLEIGVTPFKGSINIDVGPNKLVLEKTGFAKAERTIEVLRGQPVKVKLNMVPAEKTAPAKIAITGAEDAEIFIDGIEMGPAPFTGEVPTGRHTFEARKKGYLTGRQTSEVKFAEPLRITLALTAELSEGKIRIRTGHPDAAIRIDGDLKGTGTWEGLLSAGGHNLEVTKSGYKTRTQELSVAAEQERVLDITLEEDQSNAWIYWTVTGALVAAGAATTAYFVFKPSEAPQVQGTFAPGVVPTFFRF